MNNKSLDWQQAHYFLAVVKAGSLSAAARNLKVSQPTLSRQILELEKSLRLQLFQRSSQGLRLTDAGHNLIEAAEQMEQASEQFLRQASGLSAELSGDLRISANEILGIYLLPPAIAAFTRLHPQVQIELVISNQISRLDKREADIALRMFQPTQVSLAARRIAHMELGFFAHRDYLTTQGEPHSLEEIKTHRIIGFDQHWEWMGGVIEGQVERHDFALRCDHMLAHLQWMRAAAGIGVTHIGLARHWPELQQIMHWMPLPALECWIVCHSDTQYSAKIRTMTAFLADWLSPDPYARVLL